MALLIYETSSVSYILVEDALNSTRACITFKRGGVGVELGMWGRGWCDNACITLHAWVAGWCDNVCITFNAFRAL